MIYSMLSLGLYPKGPYLSLEKEKENFCVVFTYSLKRAREIRYFHVVVVQWRKRIVQKNMMQMQSYCFAHCCPHCRCLLKLTIVVIQKFCYHGNVTSHFSSLLADYSFALSPISEWIKKSWAFYVSDVHSVASFVQWLCLSPSGLCCHDCFCENYITIYIWNWRILLLFFSFPFFSL